MLFVVEWGSKILQNPRLHAAAWTAPIRDDTTVEDAKLDHSPSTTHHGPNTPQNQILWTSTSSEDPSH